MKSTYEKTFPSGQWQPIETAPKDGTVFQIWFIDKDGDGYWCPFAWYRGASFMMDDGYGSSIGVKSYGMATHWMPHPSAPEKNDE